MHINQSNGFPCRCEDCENERRRARPNDLDRLTRNRSWIEHVAELRANYAISVNEARALLGLAPLDGYR